MGAFGACYLVPSTITYETKINSRTVKGERTGAGASQDGGTSSGGMDIVGEDQGGGGSGMTVNGVDRLVRSPGQVQLPADSRADVSAHGFWKRGTTEWETVMGQKKEKGEGCRPASPMEWDL